MQTETPHHVEHIHPAKAPQAPPEARDPGQASTTQHRRARTEETRVESETESYPMTQHTREVREFVLLEIVVGGWRLIDDWIGDWRVVIGREN
jgi:hypothetical protein